MIVCSDRERTPCGACENCRKADENIHPDIITVTKPEDRKSFLKDDVKKVVADAYLTPNEANKKVYILSEIHQMTEESQNLLLKILEEPPHYTTFVLTSQTANAVIGTVLSRVVRLRLGKTEEAQYSEKAVNVVAELSKAISSSYEYDKIKATAPLDGNKKLTVEVLELFTSVLRDSIAIKSNGNIILEQFREQSTDIADKHSLKKLLEMYDTVDKIYRSLENNPNYTLLSAVLCARL
jgi:DNA polymerase III gamma/tau subunit